MTQTEEISLLPPPRTYFLKQLIRIPAKNKYILKYIVVYTIEDQSHLLVSEIYYLIKNISSSPISLMINRDTYIAFFDFTSLFINRHPIGATRYKRIKVVMYHASPNSVP